MKLTLIGYWNSDGVDPSWPDPRNFIDPTWDAEERADVAEYLSQGFVWRAFMGFSLCRLCGRENGALEMTDGEFVWPEGLAHYVSQHDVRLPARFVEHAQTRMQAIQSAEREDMWWTKQANADSP